MNQVKIQTVNFLNVAEGLMWGTQLKNVSVEIAELVLNQVKSKVDHTGYDKVDVTATVVDDNGETQEIGIRYDVKADTDINLLERLHESIQWWAESPYTSGENKAEAQKWADKAW